KGHVRCALHRRKDADRTKERAARRIAAGLCVRDGCEDTPGKGHIFCSLHRRELAERQRERSRERKAAGLCRACDAPTEYGLTFCDVHRTGTNGTPAKGPPLIARRAERERQAELRRNQERN